MRVFSILTLLLSFSLNLYCEFIPPAGEVCLGDLITYHCLLSGTFSAVQEFLINSTTLNLFQINLDNYSGLDLSRISATVDNTLNPNDGTYTDLRANITLFNITKEDNNTLIGCSASIDGTIQIQIKSDTLILASPPPEPSIQVVPIAPNCTVRVSWSYPYSSQPLTQDLSDSVSGSLSITSGRLYFSSPLTAGEETSYTLLATHCLGEVTASAVFTPPSQPDPIACSATYGTEDRRLVIQILGYWSGYSIETSFSLFTESDTILTGNFSEDSPYYYSRNMFDIQATSNHTVRLTSVLRDCLGSGSVMCEAELNITLMAPLTTTTTTTMVDMSATTLSQPSSLASYAIYILIAGVLTLVLLMLFVVILFLAYLLRRSRTSRLKSFPKKRLYESHAGPPEVPETGANGEELHYIQPDFSQTPDAPKPKAAFPQTHYTDINQASVAMQSL